MRRYAAQKAGFLTLFGAFRCSFDMLLQRGCIPRSGCQRQRAGQRAGTKAQGGLRPDGSGGAWRSLQADHAGGALSRPDGSRAQRQAATDSSRGRIARAQGKPPASGANPSRKPPAPASRGEGRDGGGARTRSNRSSSRSRPARAAEPRAQGEGGTDQAGRATRQPPPRQTQQEQRRRGKGGRGIPIRFPPRIGGSERAAARRNGSSSSPQQCIITRQRIGHSAGKENVISVEKLRGGCFGCFSFMCFGFCRFGVFRRARCFYMYQVNGKPPEVGGRLCLHEGL